MNKVLNKELGAAADIDNYKIVVIGDINVGKTSILSRFRYGTVDSNYIPTVGIDFFTKNIFYDDKAIRLILWDTAGQERFRSLIPSYLKNADCIIIVFDITNKDSFISVNHWLKDAKEHTMAHTFYILCGNKSDLKDKRNVTTEEINKYCEETYLTYIECSAMNGEGVKDLFNNIALNLGEINFSKSLSVNVNFRTNEIDSKDNSSKFDESNSNNNHIVSENSEHTVKTKSFREKPKSIVINQEVEKEAKKKIKNRKCCGYL